MKVSTLSGRNVVGAVRPGERPLCLDGAGWLGLVPTAGDPSDPERVALDKLWGERTNASTARISNTLYDNGDRIPSTASTVYAYDAVLAYASAIRTVLAAGGPLNGTALLNALYSTRVTGASGEVFFDRYFFTVSIINYI